jgi:hypothetical protein
MRKAAVVLIMVFAACIVYAQKPAVVASNAPGWHRIGQVNASFKMQNESISVLGADKFNAIKLKVTDAPINIERVQVFYESGDMQEVTVSNKLQPGAETRVIDLDGTNREIKKVTFTYRTLPNSNNDKAEVELYGLKSGVKSDSYREDKAEKEVKDTENDVEKGVNKTGDKISETAAKGAAAIKDKVYEDKVGPDGQTIYIDKHSNYYYINTEGKKVYVTKLELKDKPDQK